MEKIKHHVLELKELKELWQKSNKTSDFLSISKDDSQATSPARSISGSSSESPDPTDNPLTRSSSGSSSESPDSSASIVSEGEDSPRPVSPDPFNDLLKAKAATTILRTEDLFAELASGKEASNRLKEFRENQQVQVQTLSHAVKKIIQNSDTENYQALQQQYDSANLLLGQAISVVIGKKSLLQEALEKEKKLTDLRSRHDNYKAQEVPEEEEEMDLVTPEPSQDLGFEMSADSPSPSPSQYSVESLSPVTKVARPPSHQPDLLSEQIASLERDLETTKRDATAQVRMVTEEYKSDFQQLVQALNVAQWTILNEQKSIRANDLAKELKGQSPFVELNLGAECTGIREELMKRFVEKEAKFFAGQNVPSLAIEALVSNAAQEAAIKKYLKQEAKALREQLKELKDMGGASSCSAMSHDDTACGLLFSNISEEDEANRVIDEAFDPSNVANFAAQFSEIDGALKEAQGSVQKAMLPLKEAIKENEEFKVRRQNLVEAFKDAKRKFLAARELGANPEVKSDKTLNYTPRVALALNDLFSNTYEPESVVDKSLSSTQLVLNHKEKLQLFDELASGIIKATEAIDKSVRIVRKDAEAKLEKIDQENRDIEKLKASLVENLNYVKSRLDAALQVSAKPNLSGISDGEEVESQVLANTFSGELDLKKFLNEAFASLDGYSKKQDLYLKIQTQIRKAEDAINSSIEAVNAVQHPMVSSAKQTVESKIIATSKKPQATPVGPEVASVQEENDAVLTEIESVLEPMGQLAQEKKKGSKIRQPDFGEFVSASKVKVVDENGTALNEEELEIFQNQVTEIFSGAADDGKESDLQVKMRRSLQDFANLKKGDQKKLRTFLRQVRPFILDFSNKLAEQERALEEEQELQELIQSNKRAVANLGDALQRVADVQDQDDFEDVIDDTIQDVIDDTIQDVVSTKADKTSSPVDKKEEIVRSDEPNNTSQSYFDAAAFRRTPRKSSGDSEYPEDVRKILFPSSSPSSSPFTAPRNASRTNSTFAASPSPKKSESEEEKSRATDNSDLSRSSSGDADDKYSDVSMSPRVTSTNPVEDAKALVKAVRDKLMKLRYSSRSRLTKNAMEPFKKGKVTKDTRIYNIFLKLSVEDEEDKKSRIDEAYGRIENAFAKIEEKLAEKSSSENPQDFLDLMSSVALGIEEQVNRELDNKAKESAEQRPSSSVSKRKGATGIEWIKKGLEILNINTEKNLLLTDKSGNPYNTHKFMRALNLVSALNKDLRDKLWDPQTETGKQVQDQISLVISHGVTDADKSILTRFLLGEQRWKEILEGDKKLTETDVTKIKTNLDLLVSVVPQDLNKRISTFHGHALHLDPKGMLVQQPAINTDQKYLLGIKSSHSGIQTHQLVALRERARSQ